MGDCNVQFCVCRRCQSWYQIAGIAPKIFDVVCHSSRSVLHKSERKLWWLVHAVKISGKQGPARSNNLGHLIGTGTGGPLGLEVKTRKEHGTKIRKIFLVCVWSSLKGKRNLVPKN